METKLSNQGPGNFHFFTFFHVALFNSFACAFLCFVGGISICSLTAECNNSSADSDEDVEIVRLIFTPLDSGVSVQQVSCGLEHTLLLTQHGGVMSFGSGR